MEYSHQQFREVYVHHHNINILHIFRMFMIETISKVFCLQIFSFPSHLNIFASVNIIIQIGVEILKMPQSNQLIKKYSTYTREMRIKLIQLVEQQKFSTAKAARLLGIKQTSACRIIKSYCQHNRIFEKKAEKESRQKNLRGLSFSLEYEFLRAQPCLQTLKLQNQMVRNDGGVSNLQVFDKFNGIIINSSHFFAGGFNTLIFNSHFGFPYSYYQFYMPNNSLGPSDCVESGCSFSSLAI